MATPLFSVYVREVFPRAVLLTLTSMASEVTEEELSNDFGLQLLLEGRSEASANSAAEESSPQHTDVLDDLRKEMFPLTITLPEEDPDAQRIIASGKLEGRTLLGVTHSAGHVQLRLERNYAGFRNAAEHYVYYIVPVETVPGGETEAEEETPEGEPSSLRIAIAGRHEWLFNSLRKGMLWESTAYSFSDYEE